LDFAISGSRDRQRGLAAANADREGENENRRKSQNPIFVAGLSFRRGLKEGYRLWNKLLFVVRKCVRTMEE
jgi:hypothetical protein